MYWTSNSNNNMSMRIDRRLVEARVILRQMSSTVTSLPLQTMNNWSPLQDIIIIIMNIMRIMEILVLMMLITAVVVMTGISKCVCWDAGCSDHCLGGDMMGCDSDIYEDVI